LETTGSDPEVDTAERGRAVGSGDGTSTGVDASPNPCGVTVGAAAKSTVVPTCLADGRRIPVEMKPSSERLKHGFVAGWVVTLPGIGFRSRRRVLFPPAHRPGMFTAEADQ